MNSNGGAQAPPTHPCGAPGSSREPDYDVIVVGSGFGGSVAALRLVEKGYRVAVLEAGRRFADTDFPKTTWDLRRYLFAPRLGCFGIQRINVLRDVIVLGGAGVGGGSLVYGNTLYRPRSDAFYRDPQWAGITDWRAELEPHYDTASRMLGVTTNPTVTPPTRSRRRWRRRWASPTPTARPTWACSSAPTADCPASPCPTPTSVAPAPSAPVAGSAAPA